MKNLTPPEAILTITTDSQCDDGRYPAEFHVHWPARNTGAEVWGYVSMRDDGTVDLKSFAYHDGLSASHLSDTADWNAEWGMSIYSSDFAPDYVAKRMWAIMEDIGDARVEHI